MMENLGIILGVIGFGISVYLLFTRQNKTTIIKYPEADKELREDVKKNTEILRNSNP